MINKKTDNSDTAKSKNNKKTILIITLAVSATVIVLAVVLALIISGKDKKNDNLGSDEKATVTTEKVEKTEANETNEEKSTEIIETEPVTQVQKPDNFNTVVNSLYSSISYLDEVPQGQYLSNYYINNHPKFTYYDTLSAGLDNFDIDISGTGYSSGDLTAGNRHQFKLSEKDTSPLTPSEEADLGSTNEKIVEVLGTIKTRLEASYDVTVEDTALVWCDIIVNADSSYYKSYYIMLAKIDGSWYVCCFYYSE